MSFHINYICIFALKHLVSPYGMVDKPRDCLVEVKVYGAIVTHCLPEECQVNDMLINRLWALE